MGHRRGRRDPRDRCGRGRSSSSSAASGAGRDRQDAGGGDQGARGRRPQGRRGDAARATPRLRPGRWYGRTRPPGPRSTTAPPSRSSSLPGQARPRSPTSSAWTAPRRRRALADAGFVPASAMQYDLTAPAGQVVEQLPAAGEQATAGSQVGLLVSKGRPEVSVSVPDVTGMTQDEATTALADAGLVAVPVEAYVAERARGRRGRAGAGGGRPRVAALRGARHGVARRGHDERRGAGRRRADPGRRRPARSRPPASP